MSTFAKRIRNLPEQFAAFSLRERALVCLALLGVTWMLWQLAVADPFDAAQAEVTSDVRRLKAQLQAAALEQTQLRGANLSDPDAALRGERDALKRLLQELDRSVSGSLSRFVPPQRMTDVLEDVLTAHPGLKLKLVQRLPTVALLPQVPAEGADSTASAAASPTAAATSASTSARPVAPNLYMHPLRIEVEGRYFDVLAYLRALEQGDWRFNWRRFDFTTATYPTGRAVIEIETLSRDERWLGV